jgi:hypothetical protein
MAQHKDSSLLKISGYVELYYAYDLANPKNNLRPDFIFSHNRHNELALNIGMIKASVAEDRVRANFALMAGTYTMANLAHEPLGLRNIFEANIGIKLLKQKKLWLDVGILPSHIGFESPIGMDCMNMTRSIIADNTPYYETGLNLNYTSDNEKWLFGTLMLNGWQRMQRLEAQQKPSFGHQITWKPNKKLKLNSSSFLGYAAPDSLNEMRLYHNFFMEYSASNKLEFILGLDGGIETNRTRTWGSATCIAQYRWNEQFRYSARFEYFIDDFEVIISKNDFPFFECLSYSINMDYQPSKQAMLRLEFRHLRNTFSYFQTNQQLASRFNYFLGSSLCYKF